MRSSDGMAKKRTRDVYRMYSDVRRGAGRDVEQRCATWRRQRCGTAMCDVAQAEMWNSDVRRGAGRDVEQRCATWRRQRCGTAMCDVAQAEMWNSDVRRGAGRDVEQRCATWRRQGGGRKKSSGRVVLKSEQTCKSKTKEGQQKKNKTKTKGIGDEVEWSKLG